ncbi:hypothetical protein BDZ91DRAFT_312134 [Kalaharituber pfeilii]|nr:hypothetical protein BDZ91DRAFT_312134 [Kalaharituber pfeilii]
MNESATPPSRTSPDHPAPSPPKQPVIRFRASPILFSLHGPAARSYDGQGRVVFMEHFNNPLVRSYVRAKIDPRPMKAGYVRLAMRQDARMERKGRGTGIERGQKCVGEGGRSEKDEETVERRERKGRAVRLLAGPIWEDVPATQVKDRNVGSGGDIVNEEDSEQIPSSEMAKTEENKAAEESARTKGQNENQHSDEKGKENIGKPINGTNKIPEATTSTTPELQEAAVLVASQHTCNSGDAEISETESSDTLIPIPTQPHRPPPPPLAIEMFFTKEPNKVVIQQEEKLLDLDAEPLIPIFAAEGVNVEVEEQVSMRRRGIWEEDLLGLVWDVEPETVRVKSGAGNTTEVPEGVGKEKSVDSRGRNSSEECENLKEGKYTEEARNIQEEDTGQIDAEKEIGSVNKSKEEKKMENVTRAENIDTLPKTGNVGKDGQDALAASHVPEVGVQKTDKDNMRDPTGLDDGDFREIKCRGCTCGGCIKCENEET